MKIVIDIDDHEYTEIKEDAETFRNKGMVVPHLYKVIESGTPLSKGHGKIVDTRLAYQNTMQYSEQTRKMIMKVIDDSVIIEADGEVENE